MTDEATARTPARSARLRWSLLGLLLGVLVAGLVVSLLVVFGRGADGDRLDSLRNPPRDASAEREKVLAAGRTFVQRFNTYGPEMLDEQNKMPDYAAVGDLMTAKFRTVFDKNVGYAEQAVAETRVGRTGTAYAVGVAAMDDDSAELLVGGIVEFTAPAPEKGEDPITFEPLRFRYQVSLVKVGGRWLVDDLDDVDDDLPSFAEAATPGEQAPGQPADPSAPADPTGPTDPASEATR